MAARRIPASEQERLLLTEPAQIAFIVAEVRSFLAAAAEQNDGPSGHLTRWTPSDEDKRAAGLIGGEGRAVDAEYAAARRALGGDGGAARAVELLCDAAARTLADGFAHEPGLLSALGSAICFYRAAFRRPDVLAACERVGVSDYGIAHHMTDMYHHRNFRGAYTKTLAPSGAGEVAARAAVGLPDAGKEGGGASMRERAGSSEREGDGGTTVEEHAMEEDDECVLWSPTTPGVCIHRQSDDEAWRQKRFERIQMEGTKDPRRGGSGTTR